MQARASENLVMHCCAHVCVQCLIHDVGVRGREAPDLFSFEVMVDGLTWTQGQILHFSFVGALESIPRANLRRFLEGLSSRGRWARSLAQLWPQTSHKPRKPKL